MGYYHKLEHYATRMIQALDPFTFKTQWVTGWPNNIISFVLDKGCSTETSSVGDILHFACQAEEIGKMRKCFNEKKHLMDSNKSKTSLTKASKTKEPSPEQSTEWSKDHSYKHDNKYHDNFMPSSLEYPDKDQWNYGDWDHCSKDRQDTRHYSSGSKPSRYQNNKPDKKSGDSKTPTCYSCGGPHYSTDTKCPKYGQPQPAAKMYAAREGSVSLTDQPATHQSSKEDDRNHPSHKDSDNQSAMKERVAAAHSNSEENSPSEYGSAMLEVNPYSSWYSSDGELYNLESDTVHMSSEESDPECFGAIQEILSEYDSDSCPSAQSVFNSEEDSENEMEKESLSFSERLVVMMDSLFKDKLRFRGMTTLRKSSKKIKRPPRTEEENKCFIVKMKLHNLEAYVLLDSGCTTDSLSPEFAMSANLKAHELEEPVPLQLGTVGSCLKINFRLFTNFTIGEVEKTHYFDVVNIDRYDAILGTVFMRKHSIILDFECDEVRVKGKCLNTVIEGPNTFMHARQHAMCPCPVKDEWLHSGQEAAKKKKDPDKIVLSSTKAQPPSIQWRKDEIEEVDDADRHHPSGLMTSDPILLGPDEEPESDSDDDLEEIVQEFTWEHFPEGPQFEPLVFDPSFPVVLPQEQVDDLNDVLFAICEALAGKAKVKGPLFKRDLPHLHEEWKQSCQDILNGVPDRLPPLREINHHIPLVDEKKYNYYPPKCPDSMRKPLTKKIAKYCKAGWWRPAQVEQAAPMLIVPNKLGTICTVINIVKQNANMVKDVTPFPNQDLIRLDVTRAKYRLKIDLSDAYEQVQVEPEDIWKTTFATVQGVYESLVMQQGGCNAPSTFQRLMNSIFWDYIGIFIHAYLDDIFMFSDTIEEHQKHLELVFNKLCEHSLYLHVEKWKLYAEKVECLSHMID
jgi:Reverse transcriptase (RNA-dependent DNA polymerase)